MHDLESKDERVVVAVAAPLWAAPEAVEEFPNFDPSSYSSYRTWMRAVLARRESLKGRLDSVALCGESVLIDDDRGSMVAVELPSQPNGRTGYRGFMSAEHLDRDRRTRATHIVAKPVGEGRPGTSRSVQVDLPLGTTVELITHVDENRVRVRLASGAVVTCSPENLKAIEVALPAAQMFSIAARCVGVPYVWGGTDPAGIDCSGLVHFAARLGGHVMPRDAHYQWEVSRIETRWTDLQLGDLLFFGESESLEGIDHVGLYAGPGQMLHAPEEGRSVTIEPVSVNARRRHVGFGRYPTS